MKLAISLSDESRSIIEIPEEVDPPTREKRNREEDKEEVEDGDYGGKVKTQKVSEQSSSPRRSPRQQTKKEENTNKGKKLIFSFVESHETERGVQVVVSSMKCKGFPKTHQKEN